MTGGQQQRDPAAFGIVLIAAYALFTLVPLAFAGWDLPGRAFIGPFLVEGALSTGWLIGASLILVVVVIGLIYRQGWARILGIGYFGAQSALLLSAICVWSLSPERTAQQYTAYTGFEGTRIRPSDAFQIMVRPVIPTLLIAAAATVYLLRTGRLFRKQDRAEAS